MASFLQFIGAMTWLAVLVLLVIASVGLVLHLGEILAKRIEFKAIKDERERIAKELITDSRWFGESKEAQLAIYILGNRLLKDAATCTSTTREQWRREVAATKEEATCPIQQA